MSRCSTPSRNGSLDRVRISVLTQLFPPETQAGANRLAALVDSFSAECDVTVVTLHPSYPTPDFFFEHGWKAKEDDGEQYQVCRVRSFRPHKGSFIIRGIRELIMSLHVGWHARTHDTDLVIATSPSFMFGPSGFLLALWKRVPFIWDIRDVTWRYIAQDGVNGRFRRVFGLMMRGLAGIIGRRAALVVGSNSGIVAEMESLGVRKNRLRLMPNGPSTKLLKACEALEPSRERPGLRVTYAGALGYYQGLETLIDVAALMPDVEFVLAGEGPERSTLEARASEKGATNVLFLGYLDRESVLQVYADSDLLYAGLRDLPALRNYTFPSKLFEYMAAGKPIVFVGGGITGEFLRSNAVAVVVERHDASQLRRELTALLQDSSHQESLVHAGRAIANRHRREDVMNALVEETRRLLTAGVAETSTMAD